MKELEEMGIEGRINERSYRNKPLIEGQKATNRLFSSIQSRGEHVFGVMTNILDLMHLRCIGIKRNAGMLVMGTLVHKMIRGEQIFRLGLKHA